MSEARGRSGCTVEQYHHSLDILWEALDVKGPQNKTAFELAAERIKSLTAEVDRLTAQNKQLRAACEAGAERLKRYGETGVAYNQISAAIAAATQPA